MTFHPLKGIEIRGMIREDLLYGLFVGCGSTNEIDQTRPAHQSFVHAEANHSKFSSG
jgi:hypothetical protein